MDYISLNKAKQDCAGLYRTIQKIGPLKYHRGTEPPTDSVTDIPGPFHQSCILSGFVKKFMKYKHCLSFKLSLSFISGFRKTFNLIGFNFDTERLKRQEKV